MGLDETTLLILGLSPLKQKEVRIIRGLDFRKTYGERTLDRLSYTKKDIEDKSKWPEIEDKLKHRTTINLHKIGAILIDEEKPIKLRSGSPSPVYINLREVSSVRPSVTGQLLGDESSGGSTSRNRIEIRTSGFNNKGVTSNDIAALTYGKMVHEIGLNNFDLAIFVPHGAMNMAFGVHHRYDVPVGYGIKEDEPKGHGVPKYIHARLYDECDILVLDDVMTTGGSIKDCVDKINKECEKTEHGNGFEGVYAGRTLIFVDRLQGGSEELRNYKTPVTPEGIETHYVIDLAEMLDILYSYEVIGDKQYDAAIEGVGVQRRLI